ncbi:hypothetical protein V2J09_009400 [Rumex salicifolius]
MKEVIGSPGTKSGLVLRLGQFMFAAASLGVMVDSTGFASYTAFWFYIFICTTLIYLVASMGLQVLWSLGLACLDVHALRKKKDLHNPILVSLFVVGDWVTATLSLAAACSSAGIVVLYSSDLDFCNTKNSLLPCSKFQISVAFAFATWFLIAVSSHVMFWILASV